MTTTTLNSPFPPQGHQIVIPVVVDGEVTNPGTLVSVVVPSTNNTANNPAQGSINTGSAGLKAVFYDAANAAGATGTPLASVDTAQGYAPIVLNLPFTKGLYCVQHSGSAIEVTTA